MNHHKNWQKTVGKTMAFTIAFTTIAPATIVHAQSVPLSTQVKNATTMVSVAEALQFPSYTEDAKKAVNALPNSSVKTALLNRLAKVQTKTSINLLNDRLNLIQQNKWYSDYSYAQSLVNQITDSNKTVMQAKLYDIQDKVNLYRAENRITALKRYGIKDDLTLAQSLASQIKNASYKQVVLKNLEDTSNQYYGNVAKNRMDFADKLSSKEYIESAKQTINLIKDTSLQDQLKKGLNQIEDEVNTRFLGDKYSFAKYSELLEDARLAEEAMIKNPTNQTEMKDSIIAQRQLMEEITVNTLIQMVDTNSEMDIDMTMKFIQNSIKDASVKENGMKQLNDMKQRILKEKADFATNNALSTKLSIDVDFAKMVISQLQDTSLKSSYLSKINTISPVTKDAFSVASDKIAKAEKTSNIYAKELAQYALSQVSSNDTKKAYLQSKMNSIMDVVYEKYIDKVLSVPTRYFGQHMGAYQAKTDMLNSVLSKIHSSNYVQTTKEKIVKRIDIYQTKTLDARINVLSRYGNSSVEARKDMLSVIKKTIDGMKTPELKQHYLQKYAEVADGVYSDIAYLMMDKAKYHYDDLDNFDIDFIKKHISPISNKELQASLNEKLKNIQQIVIKDNLDKRIKISSLTKDLRDADIAKNLLSQVVSPSSTIVNNVNNANDSLRISEINERLKYGNLQDYDINRLKALVSGIKNATLKSHMSKRVSQAENALNLRKATKYVDAVNKSRLSTDYQKAKSLVAKLPASRDKTKLNAKLTSLSKYVR